MLTYYYPKTLKAITVALTDMFDDIIAFKYTTGDMSGVSAEQIDVPITFGPLDKASQDRTESHEYVQTAHDNCGYTQSTEFGRRYYLQVPRMALVLNGMAYAADRAAGVNEWRDWFAQTMGLNVNDANTILRDYQPTPIDYSFSLFIKSDQMDYLAQILENILPYFNPKLFLRVKEFSFLNIERDLPVIINGIGTEFVSDMQNEDTKYINATLDITVEGYMYRPWEYTKIIKIINSKYFIASDIVLINGETSATNNLSANSFSTSAIQLTSAGTIPVSADVPTVFSFSGNYDDNVKDFNWYTSATIDE